MQNLLYENAYKILDSCVDKKIQSNLLGVLRQYKMYFTETEWKFLNDKHHEVSNFYGLPKIHKSKIIKFAMNTQNSEFIGIFNQIT